MSATIRACCRARMLGAILLLALLTHTRSAFADPKPLTKAEKERIDAAIKKGVDYLRRTQRKDGTWDQHVKPPAKYASDISGSRLGYDFLPGLALLECGVPPSDPGIQKIAELVRKNQRKLEETFTLSLAILFLDRLGEARDEALIQSLAVRLLAGQCRDGAWSYRCPSISERNEKVILETIRKLWPPIQAKSSVSASPSSAGKVNSDYRKTAAEDQLPSRSPSSSEDPSSSGRGSPNRDAARLIPTPLRILTVFQSVSGATATRPIRPTFFDVADTESCATHFALMALWKARRHGVPVDQTLLLLSDYFQRSQLEDGTWPYRYRNGMKPISHPETSRNMTCIGLIGLATGHALRPRAAKSRQEIRDPRVLKSFARLDRELSRPTGEMNRRPRFDPGIYFLWMVQQTAQAYCLEAIGDKDWYRWGAECLITTQTPQGNWSYLERIRPGNWRAPLVGSTPATSLVLLFLKRYDPNRPLSDRIRLDPKQRSK
jgi:hypothetical protein